MKLRRLGTGVCVLALVMASLTQTAGAESPRTTSPVLDFHTLEPIEGASATLTRTNNGLSFIMDSVGDARHALTVWWAIFNKPSMCSDGCGGDEFMATLQGDNPWELSVLNADGSVVNPNGDVVFTGRLNVGDDGPGQVLIPGGLTNPKGAEVHLVVLDHGPVSKDRQVRYDQLHTFTGGCGGPCPDIQVALFFA